MKLGFVSQCLWTIALLWLLAFAAPVFGQSTSFTYQGRLTDGGTPANGNYDFHFDLYDTPDVGTGTRIGQTQNLFSVPVSDGIFSVTLDFGAQAFLNADRYLQIVVQRTGDPPPPILLSPRQKLTSTPYAIRSISAITADTATNATQLAGVDANQYVVSGDVRLSDARPPTAGSSNYIQNSTTPQAASNFNITGTGQANAFDAATQFKISGSTILSNAGTSNLFAGQGAGAANNLGNRNSFFGYNTGNANTIGEFNSFFGNLAGQFNKDGRSNDFFGDSAGGFNGNGSNNSFFGSQSGNQNTSGSNNTFLGNYAGQTNTTGNNNTSIGYLSNVSNNNLSNATAIGANARVDQSNSLVLGSINGVNFATADTNVGIGTTTPVKRLHVIGDGLFEGNLNVTGSINGTFNGTIQTANNALSLGGVSANQYVQTGDARLSDARPPTAGSANYIQNGTVQQAATNFNVSGTGQADSFDAATQFKLGGVRVLSTAGTNNLFAGTGAGQANTTGASNAFFGNNAGPVNDAGTSNSFFGSNAGFVNTSGNFNAFFGAGSGRANVDGNNNAFFGFTSGRNNASGFNNSFFGNAAGFGNTNGGNNSYFGWFAGKNNTLGQQNTFVGANSGATNVSGGNNTLLGYGADVGAPDNSNATAIGAQAFATQANSLVLGAINGVNGANFDTNVGIGTTAPTAKLHVVGDGLFTGNLTVNGTLNANIAPGNANYIQNTTTQQAASNFNISGNGIIGGNVGIGTTAPNAKLRVIGDANIAPVLRVESTSPSGQGVSFNENIFFGVDGPNFGVNVAGGRFAVSTQGPVIIGLNGVQPTSQARFQIFDNSGSIHFGGAGCSSGFTGLGFASSLTCTNFSLLGNGTHTILNRPTGGGIFFREANVDQMAIAAGGNVGIGTTAPTTRLHIVSAQNPGFQVETDDTSFAETQYKAGDYIWRTGVGGANVVNGAANKYYIYDINAGQFRMAIDTVGNVGIGTTSPTSKLHVVGDGLFTGNLTVNGNLNGNFSLNTVNASTQYDLGGVRVLSNTGTNNFFAGQGTGNALTTGSANAFFGANAGALNSSGAQNSFFGSQSGNQNSSGAGNSFFGAQSGKQNTSGVRNSFFGGNAGLNNTTGGDNAFFGVNTGFTNNTGSFNSMFGNSAGQNNTTSFNSFFGYGAGQNTNSGDSNAFFGQNTGNLNQAGAQNAFFGTQAGSGSNGSNNAFFGTVAGAHNQTGNGNTALGDRADMATGALNNATAVGARALVSSNNSLVLGSINGVNGATADTNVGIGTTAPASKFHVVGDGLFTGNLTVNGTLNANIAPGNANYIQNTTAQQTTSNFNISGNGIAGGTLSGNLVNSNTTLNINSSPVLSVTGGPGVFANANTFAGVGAGTRNTPTGITGGLANSFFGFNTGFGNTIGNDNSFFGNQVAVNHTQGSDNSYFGTLSGQGSRTGNFNTFLGAISGITISSEDNNTMVGARSDGAAGVTNGTAVGFRAQVTQSNSLVLGSINGVNGATADTKVGIGTTAPQDKLHVNGSVRITNGGIYITNPNTLVITSPNGACWGITVDNSGALSTFPVTCP